MQKHPVHSSLILRIHGYGFHVAADDKVAPMAESVNRSKCKYEFATGGWTFWSRRAQSPALGSHKSVGAATQSQIMRSPPRLLPVQAPNLSRISNSVTVHVHSSRSSHPDSITKAAQSRLTHTQTPVVQVQALAVSRRGESVAIHAPTDSTRSGAGDRGQSTQRLSRSSCALLSLTDLLVSVASPP